MPNHFGGPGGKWREDMDLHLQITSGCASIYASSDDPCLEADSVCLKCISYACTTNIHACRSFLAFDVAAHPRPIVPVRFMLRIPPRRDPWF